MNIAVIKSQPLEGIPSASGVVKSGELYYVVGDDSPYLFTLNSNFELVSKTPIYATDKLKGNTIKKKHKPDFEALEMVNENELIVFGSGSKSPQRDICLLISLDSTNCVKQYNISEFYQKLKQLDVLLNRELNIEAVAIRNDRIYLLNRGRNVIFGFVYQDLMAYFEGYVGFPDPQITMFDLPTLDGIEAGFSGASAVPNCPYILFTASVENRDDAYHDGAIVGSFIGTIYVDMDSMSTNYQIAAIPYQDAPIKVESVAVDSVISDHELNILLVTDSDGGKSMMMQCKLDW